MTCSSLTSVDISDCKLSDEEIINIATTLQFNSNLTMANLSYNDIKLNGLLTVFELISSHKLTKNVLTSPYSIDTDLGSICYKSETRGSDLRALLKLSNQTFRSNVLIALDCDVKVFQRLLLFIKFSTLIQK
ncbi:hypothetical protein GEMRC1_000394 [Eukaryota sp. GEM-RC1]